MRIMPLRFQFRSRRAQALTEFAIVAPVMVTCLLFAMYFYEIIQVKLKAQEVGRFAAWEFTSFPLHDYKEGRTNGFSAAKSDIRADTLIKYTNLKSGTLGAQTKAFAVGWMPPMVTMRDQIEPKIPGGSLVNQIFNFAGYAIDALSVQGMNIQNPVLLAMMAGYYSEKYTWFGAGYNRFNPPGRWKFNTKGYPKVRVRLRYENLLINKKFMQTWFGEKHFLGRKRTFTETVAVVADSWRMNYGENIEGTRDKNKAYYKQVDRMAFVTPALKTGMKVWTTLIQVASGLCAVAAFHPPHTKNNTETALVSQAYKAGYPPSGKIEVKEDHQDGSQMYDTSPMKKDSEYEKSLKIRKNNFMGCHDPEKLGCFDSLGSDNPFGDYVLPPESNNP
jgi:hypothetical protein